MKTRKAEQMFKDELMSTHPCQSIEELAPYIKMNPQSKKAWVKRLRSGEYKQGRVYLGARYSGGNTTYCCLGVLGVQTRECKWVSAFNNKQILHTPTGSSATLEDGHRGLRSDVQRSLAYINDEGVTFKQIANIIEKYL